MHATPSWQALAIRSARQQVRLLHGPRVIRSVLHRPDCSQAKQTVVRRDQRKVHELSGGSQKPICGIALWQRELLGDQHDLVGERRFPNGTASSGGTLQLLKTQGNYVYTSRIYIVEVGMGTARVFRSGNSQAVRLPKQFRLKSKEVEIFRRGDEIVLREKNGTMVRAFDLLASLPEDLVIAGREKDHPQKRKGL